MRFLTQIQCGILAAALLKGQLKLPGEAGEVLPLEVGPITGGELQPKQQRAPVSPPDSFYRWQQIPT